MFYTVQQHKVLAMSSAIQQTQTKLLARTKMDSTTIQDAVNQFLLKGGKIEKQPYIIDEDKANYLFNLMMSQPFDLRDNIQTEAIYNDEHIAEDSDPRLDHIPSYYPYKFETVI